jgi:hypothetical protein
VTEHLNRPKDGFCWRCGGGYMTLGMRSRWVPHESWCPRLARLRPQTIAEQDREREALTDPADSPWAADKEPRTYYRAKSPWEADVDLGGAV